MMLYEFVNRIYASAESRIGDINEFKQDFVMFNAVFDACNTAISVGELHDREGTKHEYWV